MTSSGLARILTVLLSAPICLALLALALLRAHAHGVAMEAAMAAGAVLLAGLIATALARRHWPATFELAALPLLLVCTAATAAHAAAALAIDLSLRTIGRPSQFLLPMTVWLAVIAAIHVRELTRGAPVARAALPLLVPLLTLEGLPFAAPPAFGLVIAALVALWSADGATGVRIPLLGALFGLLAAFAAATWYAADPTPGVDVTTRLLALTLAFIAIAGDADGRAAARTAIVALLLTLLMVCLLGLFSKLLLARELGRLGVSSLGTELALFARHPNAIAPWFGAGCVLALSAAGGVASPLRTLARLTAPLAAIATLLTASRLTIVATLGVALLGAVLVRIRWRRLLPWLGAGLALLLIGVVALPPLRTKAVDLASFKASASHRLHRMRTAWPTAMERPWLGQGPRCWFRQGAFAPPSRFEGESTDDHPHCLPLALLVSVGSIGTAAVALLLLTAAVLVWRTRSAGDADDQRLRRGVALALLVQLLTNLLDAGDAIDTILPSRLPIDLAILVALTRTAAGPARGLPFATWPRRITASGSLLVGAVLLFGDLLLERGETFARAAQYDRCASQWTLAARLLPYHVPVRQRLTGYGSKTRQLALANRYLTEAEDLAPLLPTLHEYRARLRMATGQLQPALSAAQMAFDLDPTGSTARRIAPLLAELKLLTGDRAGGAQVLAALLRLDPGAIAALVDGDALRVGQAELACEELLSALRESRGDDSLRSRRRIPLRECELLLMCGHHDAALAALDALRELDGAATWTYHQFRARALLHAERLDDALAEIDRSLALDRNCGSLSIRAEILHRLDRDREAAQQFENLFPNAHSVYYYEALYRGALGNRARFLAKAGDPQALLTALQQLLLFQQEDTLRIDNLLEIAGLRGQQGDPAGELETLQQALRLLLPLAADDGTRAQARAIGSALARFADAEPTPFADHWERIAQRRGRGALASEFRVALLTALHLDERAARAREWLDAP